MALFKEIKQPDGVKTNYHRILYLNKIINSHVSIAVLSYIDEDSRAEEKTLGNNNQYKANITYETRYNKDMSIEEAYSYLKTLPEFEGAVDILEGDNDG